MGQYLLAHFDEEVLHSHEQGLDLGKSIVVVGVQDQDDVLDSCSPRAEEAHHFSRSSLVGWGYSCKTEAALERAQLKPNLLNFLHSEGIQGS